jgi:hypothetical protein
MIARQQQQAENDAWRRSPRIVEQQLRPQRLAFDTPASSRKKEDKEAKKIFQRQLSSTKLKLDDLEKQLKRTKARELEPQAGPSGLQASRTPKTQPPTKLQREQRRLQVARQQLLTAMHHLQQHPSTELLDECKKAYGRPTLLRRQIMSKDDLVNWYMDKIHEQFADVLGTQAIPTSMAERLRSQMDVKTPRKK